MSGALRLAGKCALVTGSGTGIGREVTLEFAREGAHVAASTAMLTALLPALGYEGACDVAKRAKDAGKTIRDVAVGEGLLSAAAFDELISPEAVCRLGTPPA